VAALSEGLEIADVMEIWWNENEKASDQVEKKPGDRQPNDHSDDGHKPPCGPVDGFDRGGPSLKAVRA
jgi:hypothetical protein